MAWFGDLVANVVDLLFISEVEPLNSGFALVLMDSPAAALEAWQVLHKKPIIGKRFVEVFCLFPPHCPLSRRERNPRGPIPSPLSAIDVVPVNPGSRGLYCKFCGASFATHADDGAASLATERMLLCLEVIRNSPRSHDPFNSHDRTGHPAGQPAGHHQAAVQPAGHRQPGVQAAGHHQSAAHPLRTHDSLRLHDPLRLTPPRTSQDPLRPPLRSPDPLRKYCPSSNRQSRACCESCDYRGSNVPDQRYRNIPPIFQDSYRNGSASPAGYPAGLACPTPAGCLPACSVYPSGYAGYSYPTTYHAAYPAYGDSSYRNAFPDQYGGFPDSKGVSAFPEVPYPAYPASEAYPVNPSGLSTDDPKTNLIRQLAQTASWALMHTAFLGVPALLYQDSGHVTRNEVDLFQPDVWQTSRFHKPAKCLQGKFPTPERIYKLNDLELAAGLPLSPPEEGNMAFFDLLDIGLYDTRMLLCEVAEILLNAEPQDNNPPSEKPTPQSSSSHTPSTTCGPVGAISVAEIGNDLSNRARAYLFLTETKLRSLIELFSDVFAVEKVAGSSSYFGVSLRPAFNQGPAAIEEMEAFQLTRRRRKGKPQPQPPKPAETPTPPLEERPVEVPPPDPGPLKLITSISARSDYHNDPIATILRGTSATTRERVEALALERALSCLDANTFDLLAGFASKGDHRPGEGRGRFTEERGIERLNDEARGDCAPMDYGLDLDDRFSGEQFELRNPEGDGRYDLGVVEERYVGRSDLMECFAEEMAGAFGLDLQRRTQSNTGEKGRRPILDRLSTCPVDGRVEKGWDEEPLGIFANDLEATKEEVSLSTLTELFLASVHRR